MANGTFFMPPFQFRHVEALFMARFPKSVKRSKS